MTDGTEAYIVCSFKGCGEQFDATELLDDQGEMTEAGFDIMAAHVMTHYAGMDIIGEMEV